MLRAVVAKLIIRMWSAYDVRDPSAFATWHISADISQLFGAVVNRGQKMAMDIDHGF